jgi:thiamine kinase-like enzyme
MDAISKAETTAREEQDARARLAGLPGFSRASTEAARLTRLVGMSNRVYRVDFDGQSVCLRIPGIGAAAAVDRRVEEVNARAAADAGVAPEVLYFGEDGVMVTGFVENTVPLRPERIIASAGALERGAKALRRLHGCGAEFAGRFQAFTKIDEYVGALQRFGTRLPEGVQAAIRKIQAIERSLAGRSLPKPCHCDPTGRNLLDTGEKVWLVDWEYSGMNDPMWDLAYFSIESLLDETGDRALLTAYLGRESNTAEAARMAIWKPVCEVLAALWALIQVAEGKPGGDFSGYAKVTFQRATERMRTPEFKTHLEGLRRG